MNALDFDVIIVGAGPAGLGVALPLIECGITRICILESRQVGASFENWPKQMRLITPSFHSNPFRQPDLNAITIDTSPADFIRSEHPTGKDYAAYLRSVVSHYQLPVREGVKVGEITPHGSHFVVETSEGVLTARFVIWAAGEFFYPLDDDFDGAEHCIHNSRISDWKTLEGEEFAVIGGYESGVDAVINLLKLGKTVHLLSRGQPWKEDSPDPSNALSPHTRDRLRITLEEFPDKLHLYADADITQVLQIGEKYVLIDKDNIPFTISTQPILATGFLGSLAQIIHHFELLNGHPVFSEEADESTTTPGLFYCGPLLEHRGAKFCFIYKFRSRFGVVASEIAKRLGGDPLPLDAYEDNGFLNQDLECCTDCNCAIPSEVVPLIARARRYSEAIKSDS
jgi:putative flavoprotein involved in K+ transport